MARAHEALADRQRFGLTEESRLSALRRDLIEVLEASHDGELPPIRPAW
jgi:hypothetical protein